MEPDFITKKGELVMVESKKDTWHCKAIPKRKRKICKAITHYMKSLLPIKKEEKRTKKEKKEEKII